VYEGVPIGDFDDGVIDNDVDCNIFVINTFHDSNHANTNSELYEEHY